MSNKIQVELSESFKKGRSNTLFFKDIQAMIEQNSNEELALILQFMKDVSEGRLLRGKNKPSWQNDNLQDLPNSEFYKRKNIWHYHCGPYPESKKLNQMSPLKINLNGETSGAVIHYQKITENHILIIGYSPRHNPFPRENTIPNPLLQRTK